MGGKRAFPFSLSKAMRKVMMGRPEGDMVSSLLQGHGGIHDQLLGPANAQVEVDEGNV